MHKISIEPQEIHGNGHLTKEVHLILRLMKFLFLIIIFGNAPFIFSQEETVAAETKSTFSIMLNTDGCDVDGHYHNEFLEVVDSVKGTRTITSNSIPNHLTGAFPNSGNPNTIQPQQNSYTVRLNPQKARNVTSSKGMSFGVLLNGVEVDPFTNEFFRGTSGANREWNINALTSSINLGTDCNNAHVQPNGKYHYHGTPNAYLAELGVDGTKMIKVGYAADGFPIYYKFGYTEKGRLVQLKSGYFVKDGSRPGDGESAPDGLYDGTYFQDYEYVDGLSSLDECNGIFGKTPESDGEYYYVITDNFPSSPLCFTGLPSDDFKIRHQTGGGHPQEGAAPGGQRPSSNQLMEMMDANSDGKLAKSEVKGPLLNDFNRLDTNSDGFLSKKELERAGPPKRRRPQD